MPSIDIEGVAEGEGGEGGVEFKSEGRNPKADKKVERQKPMRWVNSRARAVLGTKRERTGGHADEATALLGLFRVAGEAVRGGEGMDFFE